PIENRQEKDKRNIAFHLTALVNELYGNVSLSSEMINAYILQILCLIYRTYHNSELVTLPTRKADNVGSTIRRVIHYIDTHIFFIENVGTISKELSYSSSYLSRIFRAKTGMTLQNYLNYKKIEKSTDLLVNENFSVTEISDKLHYKTVQSFSKIFKRLIGISPANYLKELQKKEK
ncbi:MAG: AraC family transcriptional regulator, partial [Oscillospiraceae bacterium]